MANKPLKYWRTWMSVVPLSVLLLICVLPIAVTLYESVARWDGLSQIGWGDWRGYGQIVSEQRLAIIREIALRSFVAASVSVLIAVPFAEFIARRKSSLWRWLLLMSLNIPFLVSSVSRAFGWFHILNQNGFVNRFWLTLYPNAEPLRWLIFNRGSVILTIVAATFPFAVFPVFLSLPSSRNSFWLACDDLGVGAWRRITRVVLPLSWYGILIGWFCVFWLAFGTSVEASVVDGPVEISLGKLVNQLLSANQFASVYALGSIIVSVFFTLAVFVYLLLRISGKSAVKVRRLRLPDLSFLHAKLRRARDHFVIQYSSVARPLKLVAPILVGALILIFLYAPVWSILLLSLLKESPIGGHSLGGLSLVWYFGAFDSEDVRKACLNSFSIAIPVGLFSAALSFFFGLTWWNRRLKWLVIAGLITLALLPPDIHALGLLRIYKGVGFNGSSLLLLGTSHLALALPYCTAVVFAANTSVNPFLFNAGLELGASRGILVRRILLGITWPSVLSAFIIGFLLSINDYTRASYLSGSKLMLSQYIYGRMRSGTDPTVYAIGGANVVATILLFCVALLLLKKRTKTGQV
jgi:ABC-type spermidine/putrescine transport system permease subunit II